MDITPFLKFMVDKKASDLFFSVGAPPHVMVEGVMSPLSQQPLTSQQMVDITEILLNETQKQEFRETLEMNLAISVADIGRYRINLFRQRGEISMVVRYIQHVIPSLQELNLPEILSDVVMEKHGFILIVGAAGSGKSTALASMIDHRNTHYTNHILTIEDPIEYVHQHKKSIVDQREVGIDTLSYGQALKNALREAPDVILIGEIREQDMMKYAISYAESGHLCLSTLHASNATQALERVVHFFPEEARQQLLLDLSLNLRAIVSLRLIPSVDGKRTPATEILLNTPYVAELIEQGRIDEIKDAMEKSVERGMQTFDRSLFELYRAKKISEEHAIGFADSKNNVALKIRLSKGEHLNAGEGLSMDSEEEP